MLATIFEQDFMSYMKNYISMSLSLVVLLVVVSCRSNKANQDFDRRILNQSRTILDNGINNPQAVSFPTTNGFEMRPSGGKFPQTWALFEIRIHGDAADIVRCYPYMQSDNLEIRRAAEKTFVFLSRPNEKYELTDLLESGDILVHNLVLAYAGFISATPSNADLHALTKNSDKRVQTLASKVLETNRTRHSNQ